MTNPVTIGNAVLYQGDCLEVLHTMPDNSVDAVVTDPPYALSFMGRDWDKAFPDPDVWSECLRVLKPGGHLLSFGATRTHHRLWCQIEDAGFKIVDNVAWVYGSGFPKAKTHLKPAHEPICLAAKQGQRWLNIDECRTPVESEDPTHGGGIGKSSDGSTAVYEGGWIEREPREKQRNPQRGRWPTNLILDGSDEVLEIFAGTEKLNRPGHRTEAASKSKLRNTYGGGWRPEIPTPHYDADLGSASRFFYCAKASKDDRSENNTHPTVKPINLMRYLCRLVTPPGGTVLDPFMGSGSTGKAAVLERFRFIGIEREPNYLDIAKMRIEDAQRQGDLFQEDAA